MNLRGVWRLAALPMLVTGGLLLAAACSGGGDPDQRVGQIGGVSELATYAYTDAGVQFVDRNPFVFGVCLVD